MDDTIFNMRLYSPRWGHEDAYELKLSHDSMEINHHPKSAICKWRDSLDPEWTGDCLKDILMNDSIYPPADLKDCISYAWVSWREGKLDDRAVTKELQAVADWINITTKAKPNTAFWRGYF